jgi:hypothetical protein
VITKPLECLAHTPPFTKFAEYQLDRFANPSIGMQDHLTASVSRVSHRKPFEQLTASRFGFLSCLKSLAQNFQFHSTQGSFDTQDELIVQITQVVDLLLVPDQRPKNLTDLDQTAPILVRTGQP